MKNVEKIFRMFLLVFSHLDLAIDWVLRFVSLNS